MEMEDAMPQGAGTNRISTVTAISMTSNELMVIAKTKDLRFVFEEKGVWDVSGLLVMDRIRFMGWPPVIKSLGTETHLLK